MLSKRGLLLRAVERPVQQVPLAVSEEEAKRLADEIVRSLQAKG